MRGFNRAIIMGNLARDPEIRYTASQMAVASFSVAVNRTWRDRNGEARDDVTFIPVVVWGKAAENCERYLKKGSGVLVEGRISVRSYEAKTGEKRYVTEIVADTVQFVGAPAGQSQRRDDAYAGNSQNSGGYQSDAGMGGHSAPAPRSFRAQQARPANDGMGMGGDAFPMDISALDASPTPSDDEADIPF